MNRKTPVTFHYLKSHNAVEQCNTLISEKLWCGIGGEGRALGVELFKREQVADIVRKQKEGTISWSFSNRQEDGESDRKVYDFGRVAMNMSVSLFCCLLLFLSFPPPQVRVWCECIIMSAPVRVPPFHLSNLSSSCGSFISLFIVSCVLLVSSRVSACTMLWMLPHTLLCRHYQSGRQPTEQPQCGSWNLRDKKLYDSKKLVSWAVVSFSSGRDLSQYVSVYAFFFPNKLLLSCF